MEKLKFDESKVINALHIKDAKGLKTGIFADDIVTLKGYVEKREEKAFGELKTNKNYKHNPFENVTKTRSHHSTYSLFYPLTQKEFFGENYINYLESYKFPKYKKELSYEEYTDLMQSRHRAQKQYLFSAISRMTDWMDGEVYNADVDFGDSYGKDHGKTGKVVLLVEAPNELLAKITAEVWFNQIGGYHKSGCNYMGRGWVESKDFHEKRYFGEFKKSLTAKGIIDLIPLYDTKKNYNLDGTLVNVSFADVVSKGYFDRFLCLDDSSYAIEKQYIIENGLVGKESLKARVTKAFKNAGLEYSPIYNTEVKDLYKDFDNTMSAIIDSIKSFSKLPKDLIESATKILTGNLRSKDSYFIRPEVLMVNGQDVNKGKIFAKSYHPQIGDREDYLDIDLDSSKNYIVKKDTDISELETTALRDSWLRYAIKDGYWHSTSIHSCMNTIVFPVDNYVIVPSDHDHDYYLRYLEDDQKKKEHYARDYFIWKELVDGIRISDLSKIENTFANIEGVSKESILRGHLDISNEVYENHKCIKIHVKIENYNGSWRFDGYSPKRSFKYKYYIAFLKIMYKFGYHVVKAANQKDDKGEHGYEEMDIYFAKNRKGVDYEETFTGAYWDENIKPETKELW